MIKNWAMAQDLPVKTPKKKLKMKYPNRIRFLRRRSRLTQKELAKLVDRDLSTVSRHESGLREMDERDIIDYSRVFKCRSYEIFMKPNIPTKFKDDKLVDAVPEED
jgi:transcriptional regulator with XRE-family HTH domain